MGLSIVLGQTLSVSPLENGKCESNMRYGNGSEYCTIVLSGLQENKLFSKD